MPKLVKDTESNWYYTNTYKKGLLKKMKLEASSWLISSTYTYKTIKVPASVAKMVKAQQQALLMEAILLNESVIPFEATHQ